MAGRKTDEKWEPIDSLGTTGATVARNIRRLRIQRGLAYTELAQQLGVLGREIPTWGLRKIESGGRRVDVDDMVALAIALEVSPSTLLMPYTTAHDESVQITGWSKPVHALNLWDWLLAYRPLDSEVAWLTFIVASWPIWRLHNFNEEMRQAVRLFDDSDATAQMGWARPTPPPGEAGFDGDD